MDKVEAAKAFTGMAKLQDDMNAKVNPSWRHARYPFYRALWTELGEASDYIQWAWWKNVGDKIFTNETQRRHCFMELADALHFGISMELSEYASAADTPETDRTIEHSHVGHSLAEALNHAMTRVVLRDSVTLMSAIEWVAQEALSEKTFNASYLFAAAYRAGMGEYGLIAYYHGKNILNVFRQDNGYKQGTYRKNWGTAQAPAEDNEELAEIIEDYRRIWTNSKLVDQINNGDFARHVKRSLAAKYQSLE